MNFGLFLFYFLFSLFRSENLSETDETSSRDSSETLNLISSGRNSQIISSNDPYDCDHEWSQNKTETTQQSGVNKRIQNIHIMLLRCWCVCVRIAKMGVENVAYTNFNKRDWLCAITAYSFILLLSLSLSLSSSCHARTKNIYYNFLWFCLLSHILQRLTHTHTRSHRWWLRKTHVKGSRSEEEGKFHLTSRMFCTQRVRERKEKGRSKRKKNCQKF